MVYIASRTSPLGDSELRGASRRVYEASHFPAPGQRSRRALQLPGWAPGSKNATDAFRIARRRAVRRLDRRPPFEAAGQVVANSSVPHPIAGLVVALLMLSGIGYGIYYHLEKAPQNRERLEQSLFEPYFEALSKGQLDEAWQRYTTPRYKQLFPLARYRQHWQETFSRAGALSKRTLAVADAAYEAVDRREYTSVRYQLTFAHDYVQAVYEVVPDAGGQPRIDWAGQHQPTSSRTSPEPW
jgi:hypothetical protein